MTMNSADLTALLPLIVISATAIVVMLATAIRRSHAAAALLTLAGLAVAFVRLWPAASLVPRQVSPLLVIDNYALFYTGLILAAAFVVVILSYGYFERQKGHREELYILLLVAVLGAMVLVASDHFVSFLLGLELLSIALYALNAYLRERTLPLEAGIKYLILAAASAAFLLFGMALIYAELGTMEFSRIATLVSSGAEFSRPIMLAGVALLITGFGFKLALVPFHLWTPDIYEGAPAPVTAFVATVSKGAMFALLLRYFYATGMARRYEPIFAILVILAVASMIAGNVLALMQTNVKRILAYSSIAHMGYVLVAFLAAGAMGAQAVTFYLVAYFITTLGAFGVITVLSPSDRDADQLDDYRGLFWKRPVLGAIFTLMLLSLAGIPATAGFFAKFYIVAAGASAAIWGLIILLVLTSVVGLYYYLRVVVAVYSAPIEKPVGLNPSLQLASGAVLGVLGGLLVWLGIYPSYLLGVVSTAVRSLTP